MNLSWRIFSACIVLSLLLTGCGGGGGGGGSEAEFESYDSFDTAMIDRTKWSRREFVRRIEGGVLISELTRFGSDGSNGLNLFNPDTVNAIKADVTVNAVSNSNAEAQARVLGDFYNDGTAGGGFSGDIFAGIEIRHNGAGLVIAFFAARCENFDCSTVTDLLFDDSTFGPVALGETHTLSVAWDGSMFTYGDNSDTSNFDPTAAAPVDGPPQSADRFKGIGTRVDEIGAAEDGAFISATFDNVEVNGVPHDDFATALIDRNKWVNLEFVRRLESGKLTSALTRFGSPNPNSLEFINPGAIKGIQADVAITDFDNTNAIPRARLRGVFYNDGSPGPGNVGDVFANIDLRHDGAQLLAAFGVVICGDSNCDTGTSLIFDDTTLGPIGLGATHRLTLDWDGNVFTFGLDNNMVTFDPKASAPVAGPARAPFMGIGTTVVGIGGPSEGAFIESTFDNVSVKQ